MPYLPEPYVPRYGDPVRRVKEERKLPISHFCEIMRIWAWKCMTPLPTDSEFTRKKREEFKEHWKFIELKIRKSNLLYRMLYLGEEPRQKPCPKHRGSWSGCVPDTVLETDGHWYDLPLECACQSEDNLTGWLPNEPEGTEQLELFDMKTLPRKGMGWYGLMR